MGELVIAEKADIEAQIKSLEQTNALRDSVMQTAVTALGFELGSRVLDIGCGIGLQLPLLAAASGVGGHVTGVDISETMLSHAEKRIRSSAFSDRISFAQGDMRSLPFPDDAFDWVWSADCVGYPAGDFVPVLREIARVVRPGGRLALLAWTSQQLLPGHELLEARLNATCSAYAPFLEGAVPESHFMRALRWFPEAGITEASATTIVRDLRAPLDANIRTAMASLFGMLWGAAGPASSGFERLEFDRLCRPGSPDLILDLPEYYAFFTYTMFSGTVRK